MRQASSEPLSSIFRPRPPADAASVLRLYAIAARVTCEYPEKLAEVTAILDATTAHLVPPASYAAQECAQLWRALVRTLERLAAERWGLAGRALLDDLENIGQRLETMPLPAWERLPLTLDEAPAVEIVSGCGATVTAMTPSLSSVRSRLLAGLQRRPRRTSAPTAEHAAPGGGGTIGVAARMQRALLGLSSSERQQLIDSAETDRTLTRGEAALLQRWLAEPRKLSKEDEALVEVMGKLAEWL